MLMKTVEATNNWSANIYNGLVDEVILLKEGIRYDKMFSDDTSVSYAADSVDELQNVLNSDLKSLHNWLMANRLNLNIAKTEFMTVGSRQRIRATDDETSLKSMNVR